jgi:MoxR-like ATPase
VDKRAEKIIAEVKKVIKGKDDVIEKILTVILADGHILLEDVPGVGKTSMAVTFSKAMNLDYRRVQFTYDTMASDIVGFSVYNKKNDSFEYKQGAAFCNLLLADEINRTSPKTQAALLEVMEEGRVTVDGVTHKIPDPFICIATQNPIGSAGTQNLPESQLDRFMVRLTMGYPSLQSQIDIIKNRQTEDPMNTVSPVISLEELLEMKQDVQKIFVSDDVIRFGTELCEATRKIDMVG